ncbi:MAG: hypothetical protein K6D38_00275 [Pseudobutyrivibrio sp.]|nr:hypothetical protein [Pseudobutyrivibrio sp.]
MLWDWADSSSVLAEATKRLEVLAIKVAEQEELIFKYNKKETIEKDLLYEKLTGLKKDVEQKILVVINQDLYQLYYCDEAEDNYKAIKVWPAFRTRIEAGWAEIKERIDELDCYISNKGYKNNGEKYCDVKQVITQDDYLIIDVFARKEKL